jgi:outer membrane protein assembly factor BamE (lipoprotein component of BamABCDE complex)
MITMPRSVRFATVLFAVPLAACLYVPPVWDIGDPNNRVDSIRVGETTRSEVLSLLGQSPSVCPGASTQDSKWYRYTGTQSAGRLAYATGDQATLGEMPWFVNVYFNDSGVVEAVDTNPPTGDDTDGVPADGMANASPASQVLAEVFMDRSCPR